PYLKYYVLGAARDVTGSLNLFEYFNGQRVIWFILDLGLHQSAEDFSSRRRLPKGVQPRDINFVVISHAHIDHSGWLPALVARGFRGKVYTHEATVELLKVMLPNSGSLQEAAAGRERRNHRRRPDQESLGALYSEDDAVQSLKRLIGVRYGQEVEP